MNPHTQVFGDDRTTTGTLLRRAPGIDAQHSTTGACSLVRGELHELTPGHVRDAPIDDTVPVGLHGRDVQVFKDEQPEAVDQLAACLVREVGAPVGGAPVRMAQRAQQGAALGGGRKEAVFERFAHGLSVPLVLVSCNQKTRLISPHLKVGGTALFR